MDDAVEAAPSPYCVELAQRPANYESMPLSQHSWVDIYSRCRRPASAPAFAETLDRQESEYEFCASRETI